jgi:hypothetical protein
MRKRHPIHLLLLIFPLFITLLVTSCEEEPSSYTQIKPLEQNIFLAIKGYRSQNNLGEPFVHQFVMVREAQIYSYKMANEAEELGTQGLSEHWSTIHEKIGGYNDRALVMQTASGDEDEILTQLLEIQGADSTLLADLSQCGVGVEPDRDGINYVTVLLMKVD